MTIRCVGAHIVTMRLTDQALSTTGFQLSHVSSIPGGRYEKRVVVWVSEWDQRMPDIAVVLC